MKRRGRLLSIVLVICLAAGLMPTTALAVRRTSRTTRTASARSVGTKGGVQFVDATANPTGGIQGYDEDKKDEPTKGYHYIYYGTWNGNPIKWRVLNNQTNMGSPNDKGLFLLSEELLGKVPFIPSGSTGNAAWQGSNAQEWCKAFAGESSTLSGISSAFTTSEERGAVLPTTLGSTLAAEKVFFLSENEAEETKYGFDGSGADSAKIAEANGTAAAWWLRTPDTDKVKIVDDKGAITTEAAASDLWARPAFNLDMSKVLFTAPANTTTRAAGGLRKVSGEISEWRLVLKDASRNGSGSGFKAEPDGGAVTSPVEVETGKPMRISYTDAKPGTNEYLSAMIADDSGNILYYGQIAETDSSGNGTAEIVIPDDLAEKNYTLKVFSEQYAGSGQTGYASGDFSDITIKVKTVPTLTEGDVERISDTEATVKFTSSEGGTYYYKVVNDGTVATEAEVLAGKSAPCDTTEQTITLNDADGMSAGAKDIYILVEDAAKNKSALLKIDIPDVMPIYRISVTPDVLNFRAAEGYTSIPGQKVTVTNTGNRVLSLSQPVAGANSSAYYDISKFSNVTLSRGDTAEFTVTPKTGLPEGSYPGTVTVSGSDGSNTATAEVSLNFEVTARAPGKYWIMVSAGEGGTITPRNSEVDEGDDLTVTITPRTGYEIDTVTVDGREISKSELSDRNEYTFTDIREDHTIHVTFKAIDDGPMPTMRTLTVSASPEAGGKAEVPGGGTSGTYQDGDDVMVTATANEGYHFERWTENDNEVSKSASYQFTIAGNRNLVAVFAADAPASHTVTVNSSYAQTSGAGTYATGAAVTVQAGTRQNYRFDGWTTEDGVTFANASSATTTFTMPDKDVTVAAKWTYTGSTGTNNGTNSGNNGTTSGGNNSTSGTNSGGNGTVSDGKGGTYTGDDTPTAMWISALCTSLGLMTVLGVLGWRRRKLYPEFMGQWRGLTEKEFGQKRK